MLLFSIALFSEICVTGDTSGKAVLCPVKCKASCSARSLGITVCTCLHVNIWKRVLCHFKVLQTSLGRWILYLTPDRHLLEGRCPVTSHCKSCDSLFAERLLERRAFPWAVEAYWSGTRGELGEKAHLEDELQTTGLQGLTSLQGPWGVVLSGWAGMAGSWRASGEGGW